MHKMKLVMMLILLAAFLLSACGASNADATPTVSVALIQTQAVLTYQVQLTQTALANPTATPTATNTSTPAATFAAQTAQPGVIGTSTTIGGGQSSSCYGLTFVKDVTIPDGTQMTPGQSFTKTWQVSNSGTCAWEAGFRWNVVGGDAMGGVAVTLNQRVEPGRQYEFSVPMVAPTNQTGRIRGTWRLSDANGNFFGDAPWVEINVGGTAPTATGAAATETTVPATATVTEAPTP
jgi:hypothetical protein